MKKVRAILSLDKVGHLGTLDPIASGVLPLCLGKATRVAQYLQEWDKEYAVTLKLGVSTDTQDATGTVVEERPLSGLAEESIRKVFESYCGRPSSFRPCIRPRRWAECLSTGWRGGGRRWAGAEAHHDLPDPDREHRPAIRPIHGFLLEGNVHADALSRRGEALGVGGHLHGLVRTRSGIFVLEDAMTLDDLKKQAEEGRVAEGLTPISTALSTFGILRLNARGLAKARRRLMVFAEDLTESPVEAGRMSVFRLMAPDETLVGLARSVPDVGGYRVERLLS